MRKKESHRRGSRSAVNLSCLAVWCACLTPLSGEEMPEYEMPVMPVMGVRVANETSAAANAQAVTLLRYEPLVSLQTRGEAELQSDITVRGGIFENTGFSLGGVRLFDPQTGHYAGEIPVDPRMLGAPEILLGSDNGWRGFNSNVATIHYDWTQVETVGAAEAGVGTNALVLGSFIQGAVLRDRKGDNDARVALQVAGSYSESDGSIEFGDHEMARLGGRLQVLSAWGRTDIYAGYQSKFFGWPGMYTGNPALLETDNIRVLLATANHRFDYGDRSFVEAGVSYRRSVDDYELTRTTVNAFGFVFDHEFESTSVSLAGLHETSFIDWLYAADLVADDTIYSSDLIYGDFTSRRYWRGALGGERIFGFGGRNWLRTRGGVTFDDSNRDGSAWSPWARVAWERAGQMFESSELYLDYAETTQVPGYTALNSNPSPGAFSGNADLGREYSDTVELGWNGRRGRWVFHAAAFYREDDDLVDWTYRLPAPGDRTFRQANPVDLETFGIEAVAQFRFENLRLVFGYMYLDKEADYGTAQVDASYYALNFAEHRGTVSVVYRFLRDFEVRVDTEVLEQAQNLRRASGDEAFRMSLGLAWQPGSLSGLELGLVADNLTESNFEDIPGTPAPGRQVTLRALYRW